MNYTASEQNSSLCFAIYMIASSYFRSSSSCCGLDRPGITGAGIGKYRSIPGYMLYSLLGSKEQLRLEDLVISLMDRKAVKVLPQDFLDSSVLADFPRDAKSVVLYNRNYRFTIRIIAQGRTPSLGFELVDRVRKNRIICNPEKPGRMHGMRRVS